MADIKIYVLLAAYNGSNSIQEQLNRHSAANLGINYLIESTE
nr:hypothetical protein [Vibrio cholerae]